MIKNANLNVNLEEIKDTLKNNYYNNSSFDKNSFFFITHRSEVAGSIYLNDTYDKNMICIEYLLINNKHKGKGVEEALISLAIKRFKEKFGEKIKNIYVDLTTSNVHYSILLKMGFK